MKYRILISSINGPLGYELVTYLKKSFYIIGCDKQPYGLGKMICDEFYICPVYNQAIKDNKKFIISHVDEMWGMGTPEELNNFIANKLNK